MVFKNVRACMCMWVCMFVVYMCVYRCADLCSCSLHVCVCV